MNRPALIIGSIVLFGCGTPFQFLIHNELSSDTKITVRWAQTYQGKTQVQDETVFVPKGHAEEVFVWYGPPDDTGVDFLWNDSAGAHRIHVPTKDLPTDAYHAYVDGHHVRFEKRDWMDTVHLNLTSYMAPVWWCCILSTLAPLAIIAQQGWKRWKRGSVQS